MKKRFFSLALAFLMLLSFGVAASQPSEWARDEVGKEYPAMFESMQVQFEYQRPITRAEFAMMAFDVYSHLNGSAPEIEAKNKFVDLGPEIINTFVPLVQALGIVNGVSATEFAPTAGLTRQELCTMLARIYIKLDPSAEGEIIAAAGNIDTFSDSGEIAPWAVDALTLAVSRGIVKGVGENLLSPTGPVTVEQAMVICSRIKAN